MQKKKKKQTKTQEPKSTLTEIKRTKIRVIGIGGGGGAIVSEIATKMPRASFVAANTDLQALKTISRKVSAFNFGQNLTHGLGTGMSAELGREAALAEKDRIKKLMEGYDLCILVACLGGGAGSGAVPVFAKISKSLGNLTYGIFTLPLKFEGEKKMEIARDALRAVKSQLNAITVIPNERVFQIIDKSTPLKAALSIINKDLSDSLSGLIEIIYEPGIINIDFADLRTVLDGRGKIAYLNSVEVQRKEGSTKDLLVKVLNSPLYPYGIKGAKAVLFNIAGEKELSLSEVNQISKTISDLTNSGAKIIFGISQKAKHADSIKTTILATGCSIKLFPQKVKKKRKKPVRKKKIIEKKKVVKPVKNKVVAKKKNIRKKPAKPKVKIKPEENKVEAPLSEEATRKNGLQIKKESENVEKEMVEKENFWDTPAFLRKKDSE
ncbi:MAG: cell division protein FtsZ [Candidatus Portnoybacteria bacterium]